MNALNFLLKLALAFSLSTVAAFAQDTELSWRKAQAFVPGALFSTSPDALSFEKKLPVLIYLHGCTGIYPPHDVAWAKDIAKQGFVVVLPDSMSRNQRISNCDPVKKGGTNLFPKAYEYRQQEITYALEQLQKKPWVDQRNIFLMGHSEGGIATALSEHSGLRGLIISGWTCRNPNNPKFDGIRASMNTPILVIASLEDDWRKGKPTEGRCVDSAEGRNLMQIDLQGKEHGTYYSPLARESVAQFLKKNTIY
jgi:dienelactone hydrolase